MSACSFFTSVHHKLIEFWVLKILYLYHGILLGSHHLWLTWTLFLYLHHQKFKEIAALIPNYKTISKNKTKFPFSQPGKKKSQNNKKQEEIEKEEDGGMIGANLKGMVVMCIVMMLMMFAVHCTWVTSNAYSSPSVVLASTNYDG